MVLGVSVMALAGAVQALLSGGRPIVVGVAIAYGMFAATAFWCLAAVTRRGAQSTGSPLALADAENWLVNGAISFVLDMVFTADLIWGAPTGPNTKTQLIIDDYCCTINGGER